MKMVTQTLLLKGVGVFAILISIYNWVVAEAESQDIFFILIVTILLVLMDLESQKEQKHVVFENESLNEFNQNNQFQTKTMIQSSQLNA